MTCMELTVEGRKPGGRPRRTWLESVGADMAEPEIHKEDCPWQKEMEKECCTEEIQPYQKTDYKPIIYTHTSGMKIIL